jgi:phage/plasmid-associated DNA primase
MKKVYRDYKKYCEKESYNVLRNKRFGLKSWSVVNKLSAAKIRLIEGSI